MDEKVGASPAAAGFDVTRAVPVRVRVFGFADNRHVLALVAHHRRGRILDGSARRTSWWPTLRARQGTTRSVSPPVQYADYTLWRARFSARPPTRVAPGKQPSIGSLAGAPAQLDLATDRRSRPTSCPGAALLHRPVTSGGIDRMARADFLPQTSWWYATHLAVLLSAMSGTVTSIGTVARRRRSRRDGRHVRQHVGAADTVVATLREQLLVVRCRSGGIPDADVRSSSWSTRWHRTDRRHGIRCSTR